MYIQTKRRRGKDGKITSYHQIVEKIGKKVRVIRYLGTCEQLLKELDGGVQSHFGRL